MTELLDIQRVSKHYGATLAVDGVSLTLAPGETLALLGPSGCGKSTLLRLVAGLERPDAGRVALRGRDVTDLPPERRALGLVFQDYALFPHLSVLDNAAYGPRARGLGRREAGARAHEALALVGLSDLAARRPEVLSGGQQQRVALARALATRPDLLLLDEPLSNLDEQLRASLRGELAALFRQLSAAVLLVTHDQREALALADRVALMRAGRLLQVGPAAEVFAHPKSAWAAAFLGHRNLLPQPDGSRLLIPEEAVTLGTGEPCPVLDRQPLERGARVRLGHPLGVLTLDLSAREAAHLGDVLPLTVDPERCQRLNNDLDTVR